MKPIKTVLVVISIGIFPLVLMAEEVKNASEDKNLQTLSGAFTFSIPRSGEDIQFNARDTSRYPLDLSDVLNIQVNREILSSFSTDSDNSAGLLVSIENQLKALRDALTSIEELSGIAGDIAIKRKTLLEEKKSPREDYNELVRKYEKKWIEEPVAQIFLQ